MTFVQWRYVKPQPGHDRKRSSRRPIVLSKTTTCLIAISTYVLAYLMNFNFITSGVSRIASSSSRERRCETHKKWIHSKREKYEMTSIADRKPLYIFQSAVSESGNDAMISAWKDETTASSMKVITVRSSSEEQRAFLEANGRVCYTSDVDDFHDKVLERFDSLSEPQYKTELWKFCALSVHGGLYIDSESPLLETVEDTFPLFLGSSELLGGMNYAVLGYTAKGTIHGSLFAVSSVMSGVTLGMVKLLVETPMEEFNPFLVSTGLYELISQDLGKEFDSLPLSVGLNQGEDERGWTLFEQQCNILEQNMARTMKKIKKGSLLREELIHLCPSGYKFCCQVTSLCTSSPVLLLKNPVHPYVISPTLPRTYSQHEQGAIQHHQDSLFTATIRQEVFEKPTDFPQSTPNFYDMMASKNTLPSDLRCKRCIKEPRAKCSDCLVECSGYCEALCQERPPAKFLTKIFHLSPPKYTKDPERLVPRIIHQTWFENVEREKYPNMSRLIESWKNSGYEHHFYADDDMRVFLTEHFPYEVLEAFDALIPGPFKADLFRYCVLIIHGGYYADTDVMLETGLDSLPNDIGFMTPLDRPGSWENAQHCMWNGLMASTPAHPFLVRTVEMIVNNIRNRFTVADLDDMVCPNPRLSVTHRSATMYITGPCALGAGINDVLGRHMQSNFVHGDIDHNTSNIPGRSVLLKLDKVFESRRFVLLESNSIVAATGMPDFDNRPRMKGAGAHYADAQSIKPNAVYGFEKVYTDRVIADEVIKIQLVEE